MTKKADETPETPDTIEAPEAPEETAAEAPEAPDETAAEATEGPSVVVEENILGDPPEAPAEDAPEADEDKQEIPLDVLNPEVPTIGENPYVTLFQNPMRRIEAAKVASGVLIGDSNYGLCFIPGASIVKAGNSFAIQQ